MGHREQLGRGLLQDGRAKILRAADPRGLTGRVAGTLGRGSAAGMAASRGTIDFAASNQTNGEKNCPSSGGRLSFAFESHFLTAA